MPYREIDTVTVAPRTGTAFQARVRALPTAFVWGTIFLVTLAGAMFFYSRISDRIPVEVSPVVLGPIVSSVSSITTGTVESDRDVQVSFQTAGVVAEVLAEEGDRVVRGQVLARLDAREARANVELARANLTAAVATHERAIASRVMRETTTVTDAAGAEALAERGRADLDRIRRLNEEGIASRQDLDRAEAEARLANAGSESARARGGDREMAALEAAAAAAAVNQAEAALLAARVAQERCDLASPFDAVVSTRHIQIGQTVAPAIVAMTPVFSLVDPASLYIRANFDEVDVSKLRTGLAARLTFDAFDDRSFDGAISEIAPVISTARLENRSIGVKIRLESEAPGVMPGMSADAEILIDRKESTLVVPSDAILDRGGARWVYVVEGGRARRRDVTTGLRNWELTEIVSGLSAGENVIVSLDIPELREGSPVRVAETRRTAP